MHISHELLTEMDSVLIKNKTWKSSRIGDASFIGLECESGNVDDCNDGTDESAPQDCQGGLILSETESQCGSKCNNTMHGRRWWTLFSSLALELENRMKNETNVFDHKTA